MAIFPPTGGPPREAFVGTLSTTKQPQRLTQQSSGAARTLRASGGKDLAILAKGTAHKRYIFGSFQKKATRRVFTTSPSFSLPETVSYGLPRFPLPDSTLEKQW